MSLENLSVKTGTNDTLYVLGSSDVEPFPFLSPVQKCNSTEQSLIVSSDENVTFQTIPATFNQQVNQTFKDLPVVVIGSDEDNFDINRLYFLISSEENCSNLQNEPLPVGNIIFPSDQEPKESNVSQGEESDNFKVCSQIFLEKSKAGKDLFLNQTEESIRSESLPETIPQATVGIIELNSEENVTSDNSKEIIEDRLLKRNSLLPKKVHRKSFKNNITCDKCKVVLHSPHQYYHHRNTHMQKGKGKNALWSCAQCGKDFKEFRDLRSHELQEHGEVRMYPCPHCIHAFPKQFLLDYHIRSVHKGEKKFKCKLCGHKFFRSHDLKMHLNIHFDIKCHVCHFCGRQFIHSSNLLRHQRIHTNVKPYLCNDCGRRFSQIPSLLAHQVSHTSGGCCSDCKAKFRSIAGLRNHFKTAHNKIVSSKEVYNMFYKNISKKQDYRLYNCVICAERFRFKKGLQIHEEIVHSNKAFPCKSCHFIFQHIENFKIHPCFEKKQNLNVAIHESTIDATHEAYTCCNCLEQFDSIKESENHSCQVKLNDRNLEITEIKEISITKEDTQDDTVVMYINNETSDYVSFLPITDSSNNDDNMKSPGNSIAKVEDLTSEENLEIEICKIYTSLPSKSSSEYSKGVQNSKLKSISTKTSPNESKIIKKRERIKSTDDNRSSDKIFKCTQCWKTFTKRWNWRQHLGTHDASMRRYICAECGESFSYRSTYTTHLKKHSDPMMDSKFTCSQCPKTYKTKSSLDQHVKRIHEKQCNYFCARCSKGFFNKSEYSYHLRIHQKEYPFVCFACGKEFNHLSHLHRHERIHTGERPHKCPYCPKSFIQPVTLRIHLKKHEDLRDVFVKTEENISVETNEEKDNATNDELAKDMPVVNLEDVSSFTMAQIDVGII